MATFTAGPYAVNMFAITLAGYADGEAVFGTSSIRIYWPAPGVPGGYDPTSWIQFGGSFTYRGNPEDGDLTGGTVTSVSERDEGVTTFTLSGLSLDANWVAQKVLADQGYEALVEGLKGADTVNGSNLGDRLSGFAGNDVVHGNGGQDTIFGGDGGDTLYGGLSNDSLFGDDTGAGAVAGADHLLGESENDTLVGRGGDDTLDGGSHHDLLDGGVDNDSLLGSAGNDTLLGGLGENRLDGGADLDLVSYGWFALGGVTADLQTGLASSGAHFRDVLTSIERLEGTNQNDTLFGSSDADLLVGFAGVDLFEGRDGADTIYGGLGNDVLRGGAKNDSLFGQSDADELQGGSGSDTLQGDAGDDILNGIDGDEADLLIGGADRDFYMVGNKDQIQELTAQDMGVFFAVGAAAAIDNLKIEYKGEKATFSIVNDSFGTTDVFEVLTRPTGFGFQVAPDTRDAHAGLLLRPVFPGGASRLDWAAIDGVTARSEMVFAAEKYTASETWNAVDAVVEKWTADKASDYFSKMFGPVFLKALTDAAAKGGVAKYALKILPFWKIVDFASVAKELALYMDAAYIQPRFFDKVVLKTPQDHAKALEPIIIAVLDLLPIPSPGEVTFQLGDKYFREFANALGEAMSEAFYDVAARAAAASEAAKKGQAVTASSDGTDIQIKGAGANLYSAGGGDDFAVAMSAIASGGAPAPGSGAMAAGSMSGPQAAQGDDTFDGGTGVDTVSYAFALQQVVVDLLEGLATGIETGVDRLIAYENVIGGAGSDRITGSAEVNYLSGAEGADTLDGGLGDDTLEGGGGLDTASYAAATAGVVASLADGKAGGGAGADTLIQVEALVGSAFADTLTGDAGANTLAGGAGADSLTGGNGGDRLQGGLGADTLHGGNGYDFVDYSDLATGVLIDLGSMTGHGGGAAGDVLIDVEAAVGTGSADQLFGDTGANWLEGRDGADALVGGGGDDTLLGGGGGDQLRGGAGTDQLEGGGGNDVYLLDNDVDRVVETGGAGFDAVWTGVDYVLGDNVEKLVSMTGFGVALTGNVLDNEVVGNNGNDTLQGLGGSDIMEGNAGNDLIYGGQGVDVLKGGAGNDRLLGDQGLDKLYGGAGDDIYFVFNEADDVGENAGEGFDTVLTDMNWTAGANIEKLVSATGFGVLFHGNALGNELVGNGGGDTLRGFDGSDVLEGRGGNDLLEGGLQGDNLNGGDGNDTLDGGLGNDFLFGAAGNDLFLVKGEGVDTLAGFKAGEDDIVLSSALYGAANSGGGVARLVVGANAAATSALATLLFDPSTGQLRYDPDGTGSGAAVLIARLTGDLAAFSTADLVFGP